jgi:hypothetical protein
MPGDFYRYFVLNDTTWDEAMLDAETVRKGIDLNPGGMDVSRVFARDRGGTDWLPIRCTSPT